MEGDGFSTRAHNEPMSSEAGKSDEEAHEAHNHGSFEFAKKASEPDPPPMDSILTRMAKTHMVYSFTTFIH